MSAALTSARPELHFNTDTGDDAATYTAVMMSPDARLDGQAGLVVHWVSGSLSTPDDAKSADEDVVPYIGPLPAQGGGHQRIVLTLFRQANGGSDLADLVADSNTLPGRYIDGADFSARGFSPVGMCFFQTEYNEVVDSHYAALGRSAPVF